MTDVAVVGFAQSPCARHSDSTTNGVEMLVPIFHEVLAADRPDQGRHRLLVLGVLGLPGRPGVLVRLGGRRDRRVPAGHGVARRDGRRLGAVRGVAEDPDRRGRDRAGLRVRQVVGRRAAPGARPPARPVPGGAAVAGLGEHRGPAGPGWASTPGCGPRRRWPRSRCAAGPRRGTTPARRSPASIVRRRPARRALRRRPAARARLRAGHRRRGRGHPGRRRPGPRAVRAAGLDHRVRAPDRLGVAGRRAT